MEFIRFGLLIIVTIGLVAVATRGSGHSGSRTNAGHRPGAPSTSTGAGTQGSTGHSGHNGHARTSAGGSTSSGGSGSGSGSTSSGGSGSGGVSATAGQPELPRTGTTEAELAGLGLIFIAGGTLSIVAGRSRPDHLSD
ncbi:MAG: hypothetical protein JO222_14820 [Frankiales bacterium]|nr:hypothetical protein [Frankiales bacterium]